MSESLSQDSICADSSNHARYIRLIDFEIFENSGRILRSPQDDDLTCTLESIDRDNSLLIFISHRWMRPCEGSDGWDGSPHPDNSTNDKYSLCVSGIRKLKDKMAPRMKHCYVWMDFSCIDQDNRKKLAKELKRFDKIMECCDVIFTPMFDFGWQKLMSTSFADGPHIYLNRGWCRVEMLYAANIPTMRNSNSVERFTLFDHILAINCRQGWRPHFTYSTETHAKNLDAVVLPPLQIDYLEKFNPLEGHFTVPEDLDNVRGLMCLLKPNIDAHIVSYGYTGGLNEAGERHGYGVLVDKAGFSYYGDWKNGKMCGRGLLLLEAGTYFEGEFDNDMYHGEGSLHLANGVFFKGNFKWHRLHGRGSCYSDGNLYEGEWNFGTFHGHGVMKYANGDVYEGEWKMDKKDGHGILRYANGSVYEGEFRNDRPT